MIKIYKVGGGILDNESELTNFLEQFSKISDKKILVHGGGKEANKLLEKLNIKPIMIDGRRVTDQKTLDIVTQLYAGKLNKKIVANLQKNQLNAIGLCGADGNVIIAKKRPIQAVDYGFVGNLDDNSVNTSLIESLLNLNLTPVFCAITHDGNGQLLNTNADTIASEIAIGLTKNNTIELHFCFDKIGVLKDITDQDSLIPYINSKIYSNLLANNTISDGMIPKLENAFMVLNKGVSSVFIEHSKNIQNSVKTTLCL
ncbi:MAG: acetylglutamate kinase [Solirubrobacteraceae bacterium]